jgi:N-methylhydantoinase A
LSFICGVDIGGTFTDCVVLDGEGSITISKTPSTPDDFSVGFFESLRLAAEAKGLTLRELMADTATLAHGTTVATNAVVERRGAKVGLLTTAGHGDAILIMRAFGRVAGRAPADLMRLSAADKPVPIVPRSLIREIPERIDARGDVVVELNEAAARQAIAELLAEGVEGLAISFLWSFKNGDHERRVRELVEAAAPDLFVTCSSELAPLIGEYERTVAAVLNNYVGPVTSSYIDKIQSKAKEEDLGGPFFLMQCSGGLTAAETAKSSPLLLLQSGPSGGVVGSQYLGELMGFENIIATDMGGTTFDMGLVSGGVPARTSTTIVDQYEYYVPTIDVKSIGAGGGSIAWFDEVRNALRVGPQSAGAAPGPVCYGRGGTEPTVTDADVVLGYIDPDYFLGGRAVLDREAAWNAVAKLGEQLGLDPLETAAGINRIVDHNMADLIRRETIEIGLDPRDFVIFTYGGAGASHAGTYARELGASTVVVPLADTASVWSALGVACSEVIHIHQRDDIQAAPFDLRRVVAIRDLLHADTLAEFTGEGFADDEVSLRWTADIRHRLQVHVVEVPFPGEDLDEAALERLVDDFTARYEELYGKGTAFTAAGVELVTLRCTGSASSESDSRGPRAGLGDPARAGARRPPRDLLAGVGTQTPDPDLPGRAPRARQRHRRTGGDRADRDDHRRPPRRSRPGGRVRQHHHDARGFRRCAVSATPTTLWDGVKDSYIPEDPLPIDPAVKLQRDSTDDFDAVTYEVVRHALWNVNDEHGMTIEKVSGSPFANNAHDFNTVIVTEVGEYVFFGPHIQFFSGVMDLPIKWILQSLGKAPGINEGDMFLSNDPWIGAGHQSDVQLSCPVFWQGEIFCWVANALHQYDVGGNTPGSFCADAESIFDEPVPIPPLKMVEADPTVEDGRSRCDPPRPRTDVPAALAPATAGGARPAGPDGGQHRRPRPHHRLHRTLRRGNGEGDHAQGHRRRRGVLRPSPQLHPRRHLARLRVSGGGPPRRSGRLPSEDGGAQGRRPADLRQPRLARRRRRRQRQLLRLAGGDPQHPQPLPRL